MKRSIKSLVGYAMKETDGEIGKVAEFYFDDVTWTIRYFIVKTGNWLSGRKVLISPVVVKEPDWENREFPVNLTKKQIEDSPDIDTDKPVSRQQEELLSNYYPWRLYWGSEPDEHGGGIFGMMPGDLYDANVETNENSAPEVVENVPQDQHLRSTDEVIGYTIHATDGEVGKISDYIIDDTNWKIKFLVVSTGSLFNNKKVLVSTQGITKVNWDNSNVAVNLSTEEVKNSTEFDDSQALNEG
ncbi:MAG: PRC-barrel domain-containing protein [Ginsengibacter sp.]